MIIRNGLVALPGEDRLARTDIVVRGEVIARVGANLDDDRESVDATGLFVFPGAIDPHVHFNDPGYTDREDFYHGSCSAAADGVTTVIDMPCTSIPPVVNVANLRAKLDAIQSESIVDYALFGGVSAQSLADGLAGAMQELAAWVVGFKTYFVSGMDTFGRLTHYQFAQVLKVARRLGLPVLLHAEDYGYVSGATPMEQDAGRKPIHYYRSRPEIAEKLAVSTAVALANEVGARLHVVHVSTAGAVDTVAGPNGNGMTTCETGPHYLAFELADFERIGSALKVTPPIKAAPNREQLWRHLSAGSIAFAASDHAPCESRDKRNGSIWTDYAGIPGCQTLLPFLFSEGYRRKRLGLKRFVEATSAGAARLYGLADRKGAIEPGKDADLVLIDPEAGTVVRGSELLSKGSVTPFEGWEFKGRVEATILRGRTVYTAREGIVAQRGYGRFLKRSEIGR